MIDQDRFNHLAEQATDCIIDCRLNDKEILAYVKAHMAEVLEECGVVIPWEKEKYEP